MICPFSSAMSFEMTLRYLLDTNICIYLRRRRPVSVVARIAKLASGEAAISVVTYGELRLWLEKHESRAKAEVILDALTQILEVLPMTANAAEHYGVIRRHLEAKGEIIGSNDLWIAAHARSLKLALVTNNEREFKRVPGLKVQNWAID